MLHFCSKYDSMAFLPVSLVFGLILFVPVSAENSFAQIQEPDTMTGHPDDDADEHETHDDYHGANTIDILSYTTCIVFVH